MYQELYHDLYDRLKADSGFTVDSKLKHYDRREGYGVSIPGFETRLPVSLLNEHTLTAIVKAYQSTHAADRNYIGAWTDGEMVFFDLTEIVDNIGDAYQYGAARHQLAVFDFATRETLRVN
jgi:hypothetical protein